MSSVSASMESWPLSAPLSPTASSPSLPFPAAAAGAQGTCARRRATGLGGGNGTCNSVPLLLPSRHCLPDSSLPGLGSTFGCRTAGLGGGGIGASAASCWRGVGMRGGTRGSATSGGRGTGVRGGPARIERGVDGGILGGGFRLGFAPLGSNMGLGGGIPGELGLMLPELWRGALAGGSSAGASAALLGCSWGSTAAS